jgi:hypothetical protein
MAFRYAHIRPNLPLAIRAVEGVQSTPIRPPPVTSLATEAALATLHGAARGATPMGLNLEPRSDT